MKLIFTVFFLLCLGGCSANLDTATDDNGDASASSIANIPNSEGAGATSPMLFRQPLPWPVSEGVIVKGFGEHVNPTLGTVTTNPGIDIAVPVGTPVKAIASGKIAMIESIAGYGSIVIVEHEDAVFSVYAHLSEIHLAEGDEVIAEEVIAASGKGTNGPQLHFELWHKRQVQDPLRLLDQR
jgi:murein DD-endopeptidase MepM/ murein hydrolase activator NlpD